MLAGPTGFDAARGVWGFGVDPFHLATHPHCWSPGLPYPFCHVCTWAPRTAGCSWGSILSLRQHWKNHPLIPPQSSLEACPVPAASQAVVPRGYCHRSQREHKESPRQGSSKERKLKFADSPLKPFPQPCPSCWWFQWACSPAARPARSTQGLSPAPPASCANHCCRSAQTALNC